jgi:hypothetical protein
MGNRSFASIPRVGGGGNTSVGAGPFAILVGTPVTEEFTNPETGELEGKTIGTLKINYFSSLLKSEDPYDTVTIVGLNSDISTSEITGGGNKGYVWLDVNITDPENPTANINFGNSGWAGFPVASKFTGITQTNSYVLIASLFNWGPEYADSLISLGQNEFDNPVYALRHIYQDLAIVALCGKVAIWPVGIAGVV